MSNAANFGKLLRQRARMTQDELGLAVGLCWLPVFIRGQIWPIRAGLTGFESQSGLREWQPCPFLA